MAQWVGALSCSQKSFRFDYWSELIPALWVESQVGHIMIPGPDTHGRQTIGTSHQCSSPFLSLRKAMKNKVSLGEDNFKKHMNSKYLRIFTLKSGNDCFKFILQERNKIGQKH